MMIKLWENSEENINEGILTLTYTHLANVFVLSHKPSKSEESSRTEVTYLRHE